MVYIVDFCFDTCNSIAASLICKRSRVLFPRCVYLTAKRGTKRGKYSMLNARREFARGEKKSERGVKWIMKSQGDPRRVQCTVHRRNETHLE